MKASLLLLFTSVALVHCAFAQVNPIEGALGLKWGATPAEVRDVMSKRAGATVKEDLPAGDSLHYGGGEFAGHSVTDYVFLFVEDKLYQVTLMLKIDDVHPLTEYEGIKSLIAEKYGKPADDFHYFEYPFNHGQIDPALVFRAGKGHFMSVWYFPSKAKQAAALLCQVTKFLDVRVSYYDTKLSNLSSAKKKEQQKAEL